MNYGTFFFFLRNKQSSSGSDQETEGPEDLCQFSFPCSLRPASTGLRGMWPSIRDLGLLLPLLPGDCHCLVLPANPVIQGLAGRLRVQSPEGRPFLAMRSHQVL